jgi:hypothetical protein
MGLGSEQHLVLLQAAGTPVRVIGPQNSHWLRRQGFRNALPITGIQLLGELATAITRHATRALLFAPAIFP